MVYLLLLLIFFVPLIWGANLFVDSASALAKKFRVSDMVIGLTIVAFGTSAPELAVNIFASLNGNSPIVLGNIVGSNIVNIFLILGLAAIVYPLSVKTNTTWIEVPLSLLSALVLLVLANDMILNRAGESLITRGDGIILLLFFAVFMAYNISMFRQGDYSEEFTVRTYGLSKIMGYLALGMVMLVVSGHFVVDFAVKFSRLAGLSERIISLTIVSIGTSLPELVTSIVAARKKSVDIAIGNVVGSNIFNVFFILGISALISPISVEGGSTIDMGVNILGSLLVFVFIFAGGGRKIDRREGTILVLFYLLYLGSMIVV